MAQRKGIARFELAVILVVAAVVGITIIAVEAQSERLAMTLAIRSMRTGLQLAMAERLMRGEENRIAELVAANPMEFLGQPGDKETKPSSRWVFDTRRRELVYRPGIKAAFDGSDELRWRIDGVPAANGRVTGLRLVEVLPASHDR